jgi:hypothetical protein
MTKLNFDQIPESKNNIVAFKWNVTLWQKKKKALFWPNINKKKGKPDILFIIPYLLPEKVARVTMFLEHLMLHLSTKLDKPYTIMMAWHCAAPQHKSSHLIASTATIAPP